MFFDDHKCEQRKPKKTVRFESDQQVGIMIEELSKEDYFECHVCEKIFKGSKIEFNEHLEAHGIQNMHKPNYDEKRKTKQKIKKNPMIQP